MRRTAENASSSSTASATRTQRRQTARCRVCSARPRRDSDRLRAKLETQAPIGKLDGEIYRVPQSSIFASFKRLGNDPVLTIQATATAQSTVLTMTRWD